VSILRKETWHFAILLILLLATATLAVQTTIEFLSDEVPERVRPAVVLALWSLTMGFMLIASAFALWAIDFSMRTESRRAAGRLVGDLHFLRDGLLTLDTRGRITGANAPAQALTSTARDLTGMPLAEAYPELQPNDVSLLLDSMEPQEIQRDVTHPAGLRTYRFRSHPAADVRLLQVSDITAISREQARNRRVARLQLVGHIANGMSNDLNTILCSISGHAALLKHLVPNSQDLARSVDAITHETEQGIAMAGKLMRLGRATRDNAQPTPMEDLLRLAGDAIRLALPPEWTVLTRCEPNTPPAGLSSMLLEHVVVNLALLASDGLAQPGRIQLTAVPGRSPGNPASHAPAGTILVLYSTLPEQEDPLASTLVEQPSDEIGALLAILQSLIGEAGGKLDVLTSGSGRPVYRLYLPHLPAAPRTTDDTALPEPLLTYIKGWKVLLAGPSRSYTEFLRRMETASLRIERADNVVTMLGRIQEGRDLDALVIDLRLLSEGPAGLLRAILKLCPTAGLVAVGSRPLDADDALDQAVVFIPEGSGTGRLVRSLIDARTLATRRRTG
jgi:nitrogen-specific signal transduction histidine kinase